MNSKAKKFSFIFFAAALIVFGAYLLKYQKKIFIFSGSDPAISMERVTFLMLGKTGKIIGWNMSPDLADSVILVDYRPKIGVINLVSLPRDLYVNVDGEKFKLNEAAKREKIDGFLKQLPEITGLKTDKYALVDLDLVKTVTDNLGGLDVNLGSPAIDWVSGYKIEAGSHHLDGAQVAWLVRNRYAPNGDFFREKNQHEIIEAMISRFKKMSSMEKAAFIVKMTPELGRIQTNLNFAELVPIIEKIGNPRFNTIVLDFNTGLVESGSLRLGTSSSEYILNPKAGEGNYSEIRNYIQARLEK